MNTTDNEELSILWKRVNRQGIYAKKPIKWAEFNSEIERIVNEARTTEALAILFLVEDESSQIIIKERIKVLEAQLSSKDKQKGSE